MKYMGSKRAMLRNGLGELMRQESAKCERIVDLFCGSATVAWFAAQRFEKPVLAVDLQRYAVVLARAVIERTKPIPMEGGPQSWLKALRQQRRKYKGWSRASRLDSKSFNTVTWSKRARDLCEDEVDGGGTIWRAYGGHYFSPKQALTFDAMLDCLPPRSATRSICLAAAIIAASKCVASPGHTAQPFKATTTGGPFLREAWKRDPLEYATAALRDISPMHALRKGRAVVHDANTMAATLSRGDLVFVDPPYSGVHYSRFYHVLETIARRRCGQVEGIGRYPSPKERPVSSYSRQSEAEPAMTDLLKTLAKRGCTVILTFPSAQSSNGLSGTIVTEIASEYFDIERKIVKTRFSTMGGNNFHRKARKLSNELILVLRT